MRIFSVIPLFKRFALFEKGLQPKTVREILSIVKAMSNELSNPNVKSISTKDVRGFLHSRKRERLWSNKTFRNYRQYLKSFFDYCILEDYIKKNPVEKIEKPRLPKRLPRFLEKNQIETILMHFDCYKWFNNLEASRNKAIIRTFLYTGVRLNELLKLKTTSVNITESEIKILQGKGNKDRIIPIHPDLELYLQYYISEKKKPTEYFFSSIRSDKPLTIKNLYSIFKKIRRKSQISFTPHQLRHTFGKLSIQSNLNPFSLQKLMGHSSIETTQIYVYVGDKYLKENFRKRQLM